MTYAELLFTGGPGLTFDSAGTYVSGRPVFRAA